MVFCDIYSCILTVDFDALNFGWAQSFANKLRSIIAPVDNINLLAITNFVHYGLNAHAATTNKGANWVDTWYERCHGNLSTATSFASNRLNFYCAILNFWYFLTEEIFNKGGRATAQNQLCATLIAFNANDQNLDAGADCVVLAIDLLGFWHNTSGFTKIHAYTALIDAGYSTIYNRANLVFVANFVTCSLGGWDLGSRIVCYAVFNHFAGYIYYSLTRIQIKFATDIHIFFAVVFAPSGGNRLLNYIKYGIFWQIFFFGNDINHCDHLF